MGDKVTVVSDDTATQEVDIVLGNPYSRKDSLGDVDGDDFAQSIDELKKFSGLTPAFRRRASRMLTKADTEARSKSLENEIISVYHLTDVATPPYNLHYLAKLYEKSEPHYAAVNAKVSNVVGLGYKLIESPKIKQAIEAKEDVAAREKIAKRISTSRLQIQSIIDSWNPAGLQEVLKRAYIDYEATGNGYIEVGRKIDGTVGYVGHISAKTMRVRRNHDGFVQIASQKMVFFRNFGGDAPDPFNDDPRPNEIIHLMKYSPTNSHYGVPDIIPAQKAIAGNEFAARFNLDYFENKAVPRYVIVTKGANLSLQSQKQITEFFETGLRGKHHRTIYVPLPADDQDRKVSFEMKAVESGTQDASFVNYNKINLQNIFMAHRVPMSKAGVSEGVSLAASRDADKTFKEQVCRPEQSSIDRWVTKILGEVTDVFVFKLNELSLTDEDTKSKIRERGVRNGWDLPNEIRAEDGKPPIEGGDKSMPLSAQQAADRKATAQQSRARDSERSANAPDTDGEGRQTQGEGRASA